MCVTNSTAALCVAARDEVHVDGAAASVTFHGKRFTAHAAAAGTRAAADANCAAAAVPALHYWREFHL